FSMCCYVPVLHQIAICESQALGLKANRQEATSADLCHRKGAGPGNCWPCIHLSPWPLSTECTHRGDWALVLGLINKGYIRVSNPVFHVHYLSNPFPNYCDI